MILANKNIRNALIIGILLLLLFLLRGWWKDKIIVALGGYTTKETVIEIEKEYIKGKIDTLEVFNHYVSTNGIILNPEPEIIIKEVPGKVIGDTAENEKFKRFNVSVSDSLLLGSAIVLNDFEGNLHSLEFNYKPLFPKYITRTDTIRETKTITNTLTNERTKLGIGLGYNNLNHGSILASYTTKSGWQFIGEYGKSLQNVYIPENIDFNSLRGYINPNEDLISLKIIKNF